MATRVDGGHSGWTPECNALKTFFPAFSTTATFGRRNLDLASLSSPYLSFVYFAACFLSFSMPRSHGAEVRQTQRAIKRTVNELYQAEDNDSQDEEDSQSDISSENSSERLYDTGVKAGVPPAPDNCDSSASDLQELIGRSLNQQASPSESLSSSGSQSDDDEDDVGWNSDDEGFEGIIQELEAECGALEEQDILANQMEEGKQSLCVEGVALIAAGL